MKYLCHVKEAHLKGHALHHNALPKFHQISPSPEELCVTLCKQERSKHQFHSMAGMAVVVGPDHGHVKDVIVL